jgi:hypothetical protein
MKCIRIKNKKALRDTFIPGIWTHSTAVPVAFERNSVKVSSAMDKSLEKIQSMNSIFHSNTPKKVVTKHDNRKGPNNHNPTNPAGRASLGGC